MHALSVLFPHGVTHSHNPLLCCQVPLVGYSGEQKFREELDRQMPAHDFDATKCHDLTLEEKAEFTTLKAMKKEAHTVGVAVTVSKPIPCAKCQGVSLHWIALDHRYIRLCSRHPTSSVTLFRGGGFSYRRDHTLHFVLRRGRNLFCFRFTDGGR